MVTIPNIISILRVPLALLFLKQDILIRATAIVLAMVSDGLDGFLARRYQLSSRLGTLLDPLTDRFFIFFVITVLFSEGRITNWEVGALVCRDVSLMLFGCYLAVMGRLKNYQFRAIWCGKATTFLQFINFLALALHIPVPSYLYGVYLILGVLAFAELYLSKEVVTS